MATEKLFTVAGTATDKGITKVRFANDLVARIKILNKAGCTNIDLIELPRAMTKLEALQHLTEIGFRSEDTAAVEAIANKLKEKTRVAKRAEISVAANPATLKASAPAELSTESSTEVPAETA